MKKPQGFLERLRANLHWFWSPVDAEKVWDFSGDTPLRLLNSKKQVFVIILDDGEQLFHTIRTKDVWLGADWMWPCASLHDERVSDFLREAGQFGVTVDGTFYPHSRIDRIIPGGVESWAEHDHRKVDATSP